MKNYEPSLSTSKDTIDHDKLYFELMSEIKEKQEINKEIIQLLTLSWTEIIFDKEWNSEVKLDIKNPIIRDLFELLDNIFSKEVILWSIEWNPENIKKLILYIKKYSNVNIVITWMKMID